MEAPINCCGKGNLFFEPVRNGEVTEYYLQCRECGELYQVPENLPVFAQLQTTISELVDGDRKEFLRLKQLFQIYDEKTPEQKYRGYFNMWVWLTYGPTWKPSATASGSGTTA